MKYNMHMRVAGFAYFQLLTVSKVTSLEGRKRIREKEKGFARGTLDPLNLFGFLFLNKLFFVICILISGLTRLNSSLSKSEKRGVTTT
jgi:hypothetical protein